MLCDFASSFKTSLEFHVPSVSAVEELFMTHQ